MALFLAVEPHEVKMQDRVWWLKLKWAAWADPT